MLGRQPTPDLHMADLETAQLKAAMTKIRNMCRTAMAQHAGNRDLVDLALDIDNELRHADVPIIPGPEDRR